MNGEGAIVSPLLLELGALAALSLLPFALMLVTSFVKIVIVLSLLRSALGLQQAPPNPLLNGIAILMSCYVMFPTGIAMWEAAESTITAEVPQRVFSPESAIYLVKVVDAAKEPLREFLLRNSLEEHRVSFCQLAAKSFPKIPVEGDLIVLIPAFITSQLRSAFQIGVLIYLPFFVIDLVTSNILLAMGMIMLSPLTISLPLKLLLIVVVDGWTLIIRNLVLTFH